jgi:hypothetical protein
MVSDLNLPETGDPGALREILKKASELGVSQLHLRQNKLLESLPAEAAQADVVAPNLLEAVDTAPEPPPEEEEPTLVEELSENFPEETPALPNESASAAAAREDLALKEAVSLASGAASRDEAGPVPLQPLLPRQRPETLRGVTYQIQTGYGPMKVSIAYDALGPYELNALLGRGGSDLGAQAESLSRLITLLLSIGVEPRLIFEQLRGIRCPRTVADKGQEVLSCADGIAQILAREFSLSPAQEKNTSGKAMAGLGDDADEDKTEIIFKE